MKGFAERFIATLVDPPEPVPGFIPVRWRIPLYLGIVAVAAVVLALVLWFVVMPGVRAQQSGPGTVRAGSPK